MTSRVCSKNKEKKAKRRISVKKNRPNKEKKQRNRKQRRRESNPVYLHSDTHDLSYQNNFSLP